MDLPNKENESKNLKSLKPFNMRYVSLENFPPNDRRSLTRVAAINRFKEDYPINCPFKSISLLRKFLQDKINEEIFEVLQKYQKRFIQPAFTNVRNNLRQNELSDQLNINSLMHQILEEAKKMFPLEENDSFLDKLKEADNHNDGDDTSGKRPSHQNQTPSSRPRGRPKNNSKNGMKAKTKRKRKGAGGMDNNCNRNQIPANRNSKNKLNLNSCCNIDKWNPSQLTTETLFILGSKANKALGIRASRGPSVFKTFGFTWLCRRSLKSTY